jgi:hypothetical protein
MSLCGFGLRENKMPEKKKMILEYLIESYL